ncbi:MAG: hypothetical protein WA705_11645 [Candidatus Ozemobacteraceae bacterium]
MKKIAVIIGLTSLFFSIPVFAQDSSEKGEGPFGESHRGIWQHRSSAPDPDHSMRPPDMNADIDLTAPATFPAEILTKYDSDGDGTLNASESAALRQDMRNHRPHGPRPPRFHSDTVDNADTSDSISSQSENIASAPHHFRGHRDDQGRGGHGRPRPPMIGSESMNFPGFPGMRGEGGSRILPEFLKKYDTDSDGTLNASESAALRQEMRNHPPRGPRPPRISSDTNDYSDNPDAFSDGNENIASNSHHFRGHRYDHERGTRGPGRGKHGGREPRNNPDSIASTTSTDSPVSVDPTVSADSTDSPVSADPTVSTDSTDSPAVSEDNQE